MNKFSARKTLGIAHEINTENPNDVVMNETSTCFIERDDDECDDLFQFGDDCVCNLDNKSKKQELGEL